MTWLDNCGLMHHPPWSIYSGDSHLCFLKRFWTSGDEKWISYSLEDPTNYPTAFLAISTLALAYYGKRNRQPAIVVDANRKYGQTLHALQRTLLINYKSCTFDILASITALQRYEAIVYTTSAGWIQHAGGIARAIELRGPDCFEHYPNKSLLDANGYYIIQESYHYRKSTFLALEQWRHLRTDSGDREAHFDRLQDLYARLAGLAKSVTCFLADQDSARSSEILGVVNVLLADLTAWATHWIVVFNLRPVERSITSKTKSIYLDAKGPVFRSSFDYPSPLAGVGANAYMAIKLTVLMWRHKLQHPSWRPGEYHEGMNEIPGIHQLAVEICRTLSVHFSDESGDGIHHVWFLLFCSLCAYKGLDRRSRESQWITATLTDVGNRWGVELASNLIHSYSIKWKAEGIVKAKERPHI